MIEICASADGFLRYMVRSIAGALLAVGRGEMDTELIERAIDEGDRSLSRRHGAGLRADINVRSV